jgi:hypothetical protein
MQADTLGKTSVLLEETGFPKMLCCSKPNEAQVVPTIGLQLTFPPNRKEEIRLEDKSAAMKNIESRPLKLK